MKKVKVAHDTVIYYVDRLGRRREKVVEVQEDLLEPESYAECQELVRLHRTASADLVENLTKMRETVSRFEEVIDSFNKKQILLLAEIRRAKYERSGALYRIFVGDRISPRHINSAVIDKSKINSLAKRLDEVIEILGDDILFPMVEYDYTVLKNLDQFLKWICDEFAEVTEQVRSERAKKIAQLLNDIK